MIKVGWRAPNAPRSNFFSSQMQLFNSIWYHDERRNHWCPIMSEPYNIPFISCLHIFFCNCNFPLNPHVSLVVGGLVGLSGIISYLSSCYYLVFFRQLAKRLQDTEEFQFAGFCYLATGTYRSVSCRLTNRCNYWKQIYS